MSAWELIWIGVASALIVAAILGLSRWLRARADGKILRSTNRHALVLTTYLDPDDMRGLTNEQMLRMEPDWLADRDFYFADGVPAEVPPRNELSWTRWAKSLHAEVAGWRHILIIIQATADRSVVLRTPYIEQTVEPSAKNAVMLSPRPELGGNGLMVRQFSVDLDQDPPAVEFYGEDSAAPSNFSMKKGDSESFLLIAHATAGIHRWRLRIPCLVDGQELVLTPRGDDFLTIGTEGIEALWWDFDRREWMKPTY